MAELNKGDQKMEGFLRNRIELSGSLSIWLDAILFVLISERGMDGFSEK